MALGRTGLDASTFFIALLVTFVAVQGGIWIISQYVPDFEFIKMGWILFLFLAVSAIVSIFMLGKNLGTLRRDDYIFIGIQFLAIVGLFIFLPKYIPEIFSTYSIEVSDSIRQAFGVVTEATGVGTGACCG
jgi:hypothetical protein